jgi:hypothetical protein
MIGTEPEHVCSTGELVAKYPTARQSAVRGGADLQIESFGVPVVARDGTITGYQGGAMVEAHR